MFKYLLERLLYKLYTNCYQASMYFKSKYSPLHRSRRFKERYGKDYSDGIERCVLGAIKSKNSGKHFIRKGAGASIFKINLGNKLIVYPVYCPSSQRIKTYLTKEMVYDVEK